MSRRTTAIAALLVAVTVVLGIVKMGAGDGGGRPLSEQEVARVNELLATAQQQRLDGQVAEAEASFNEILRIDSTNGLARFNVAQLLQNRNEFAAAAKEYKKVVAQRPDFEEAHIGYAVCLRDSDRVEEAIRYLRDVTAEFPAVLKYKLLLGQFLVRQGQFDEGDKLVGDVLRIDSSLEDWKP